MLKKLSIVLSVLLLICCNNNKELVEQMEKISSVPLKVSYTEMLRVTDSTMTSVPDRKYPYTMVVYMDSVSCSRCIMNSLRYWNDLFYLEKEGRVYFSFILSADHGNKDEIIESYKASGLKHEVYVDTSGVFRRQNPQITDNRLLHDLLINKNDSVVLIGDPTKNNKLNEMFFSIIKK